MSSNHLCLECGYALPAHRWDCTIGSGWRSGQKEAKEGLTPATAAKYEKLRVWEGVLERFPMALQEVARVSAFGQKKHEVAPENMSYRDVPEAYRVYTNGVSRHLLAEAIEGTINHADGDMLHAAQLVWNALARLEVFLRERARGELEGGQKSHK